jgi:hypothetical protein
MEKENTRIASADLGTMFFQTAEYLNNNTIDIKTIRNAFVQFDKGEDIEDILVQNKWRYIMDGEAYYVIGEDALKMSKLFPDVELRRPMQDGVLNNSETKKILVLNELIRSTLGKASDDKSIVCTCVSSPSVDGSPDSKFHKAKITGMFDSLGWNVRVVEEAYAVLVEEKPFVVEPDGSKSLLSGICVSLGAGRANAVMAYRGVQRVGMSVARSGDYVDAMVAEQLGIPLSKVISKKERELDFDNLNEEDDILYALNVYYEDLLTYVFSHFAQEFAKNKMEYDWPLDIIFAGGTSTPKGFSTKAVEVINRLKLPFKVKDVKVSADPRNAVVKGCLALAMAAYRKAVKGQDIELTK